MGTVSETEMVALVAVTPLTVALTVAVPPELAVIKPLLLTERVLGLLLVQLVTAAVNGTLETCGKLPVTAACWVCEPSMLVTTETVSEVGTKLFTTILGPAEALAAR